MAVAAHATPPPAGTVLANTATGSFIDSATGLNVRLTSNTVATTVAPLEALQLTDSQTVRRSANNGFAIAHTLTNSGNVASTYTLSLTLLSGGFTPGGLQIVLDRNGNGIADPGEPLIANGGTLALAHGAIANLLLVGTVPGGATVGQSAQLRLSAATLLQNTANNTDTVVVVAAAALSVTKSASTVSPIQGGPLSYTLTATNSGGGPAQAVALSIDGATAMGVVLRDAIPANTTFVTLSSPTAGVQRLFHRLGDAPGSYVSAQPPIVDAVAWLAPSLDANTSLSGTLAVTVNLNASAMLANTGYLDYGEQGANFSQPSNPVQLNLPALAPTVTFYSSNSYATPVQQALLGVPLYLQISAAQCNTDPSKILTHPITLVSQLTGDTEIFTATETAPNTGLFRILPNVPTAQAGIRVIASGDGILELLRNDRVTATLSGCGSATVAATLLIDPSGVLFDSKTNAPVAGATVQLIDVSGSGNGGNPGGPARVFAPDGMTTAPSSSITGVEGIYSFPLVAAGTYRLQITAPNGYVFPSQLPLGLLPPGRYVTQPGSYGGNFLTFGLKAPITLDVPLDSGAATGLFVQKAASVGIAEVGDFVDYSVVIANNSGLPLPAMVLNDDLPAGFAYVKGSARLDGAPIGEPSGGAGPALVFAIGAVPSGIAPRLTYRVRIGPEGDKGTGINTAQAASTLTRSNVARAQVTVSGGVFSDHAYVFGKVYAACGAEGPQGAGDPGIPGVRIYLDNGTYAITDEEGKYSLYGLTPRTYVAKIDATTLPSGATLKILSNRNARNPESQFVDLQSSELHKADFAIDRCTDDIRSQIAALRKLASPEAAEITRAGSTALQVNPVAADARSLPASGIMGPRNPPAPAPAANATHLGTPRSSREDLEQLLSSLSPDANFVDLIDGEIMPTDQIQVRVKGPLQTELRLEVNGRELPLSSVGQRSSLDIRGISAWAYIGVELKPGRNTLRLRAVEASGIERGAAQVHIIAPGTLARIEISAGTAAKDENSALEVIVRLVDQNDVPVTSRMPLTLESSLGEWQTPDLDPKEPGTQVFIEGGVGYFKLIPPATPGTARVSAAGNGLRGETHVVFMPNLRPVVGAGIVEGAISLRNMNPNDLVPPGNGDAFERQIQSASRSFDGGKNSAPARASLFLKGKILGSSLLTLAYDSDKPGDTHLFRDIQPDAFYPVYGDSSVRGFDAQSTGKLYVRVDHGTSFVLYGDYTTQSDNPARLLSQYNRALNGAKTHVEHGSLDIEGFTSYADSVQIIDELAANGTSGPYQLKYRTSWINSARLDILTRDRNQPSLVVAVRTLAQFTDYAIDSFTGTILLKAPVPSLDSNLNPIYLRVTYEVSTGGPRFWVGGVDLREKVTDTLTLGASYILDANPENHQALRGANFLWSPNAATSLVGEVAQSQTDMAGSGSGERLELKHADAALQARVYAVRTDPTFSNGNSTFTAGAAEYGAKIGYTIDKKDRLLVEAIKSSTANGAIRDPASVPLLGIPSSLTNSAGLGAGAGGSSREGGSVAFEHSLPAGLKLTVGLRHVIANARAGAIPGNNSGSDQFTSVRARLDAPVPDVPKANMFVQFEKAVDNGRRQAATVGGTYQVAADTKIYATHETSNSLNGDYGLTPSQQNYSSVLGIQTAYVKDGQLFNEYRVGDSIDGRSAQSALGLRNLWHLTAGLGLSTSIQEIRPIFGVVNDRATALTGALQYTGSPDWKGSTRVEWSRSVSSQTWLATAGAAVKLNAEITLLGRGLYNRQLASLGSGGAIRLGQAQLGFAYRPVTNDVWNALARVELKHTQNSTLGLGLNTDATARILSTHLNYQPAAHWLINARYGVKWAIDSANGLETRATTQLLGARSVWDISSQWDVGLQYFVEFANGGFATRRQALGAEAGYLVAKDVWISLGYNVLGFRDPDLAGEDYTQRAFYLRLRVKFDENSFLPRNNGKALAPDALSRP